MPTYTHSTFTLLQDQNKYAQLCSSISSCSSGGSGSDSDKSDGDELISHMAVCDDGGFANSIEICFVPDELMPTDDSLASSTFDFAAGHAFDDYSWPSDGEEEQKDGKRGERTKRLSFFESVSVVTFEQDEPPEWIQYNKHSGQLTMFSPFDSVGAQPPQELLSKVWCSLYNLQYRQPCHLVGRIAALKEQRPLTPSFHARVSFDEWATFVDVRAKLVSFSSCERFYFYDFIIPLSEDLCFDGLVNFQLFVYSTRTPDVIDFVDDCKGEKYIGQLSLSPIPCEGLRPLKAPASTKSLTKMLCDTSYVLTGHIFQL